jgi:hypothetical protein
VRNGWCRLRIIDFAFSEVNHVCPGWRKCEELRYVWSELLWPDSDAFKFILDNGITGMFTNVKLVAAVGGFLLLYFLTH